MGQHLVKITDFTETTLTFGGDTYEVSSSVPGRDLVKPGIWLLVQTNNKSVINFQQIGPIKVVGIVKNYNKRTGIITLEDKQIESSIASVIGDLPIISFKKPSDMIFDCIYLGDSLLALC